ncbi:hypothetical protein KY285_035384 [Solanum tuberosum]|nr:hypothetical protein KY285_035384 [Solanum tuberosum]
MDCNLKTPLLAIRDLIQIILDSTDETHLFELNQQSFTTKQNSRPLSTYYNKLVAIFQEIGHRTASQERSVEGIVHLHSMVARLRVHIFLSGLDLEFDQVRGEILRKDPKLDLESCYEYVRREAQKRQIMGSSRPVLESSAMLVQRDTQITLFAIIVVKKGIPNSAAMMLLDICNGEIFQKKPRKNLIGKEAIATQWKQSQPTANVEHPII